MNNIKKYIMPGAVATAALVGFGGGSLVNSLGANAATTASTAAPMSATSTATAPPSMPAHGSAAHEDAETAVTGDTATKAQAAAVASVGSGTAGAVTTDFSKTGYETTVTKSDGSRVEVHLDNSFAVMSGHGPDNSGSN